MPRDRGQRLTGCHVVSLRPVGQHAALRRAAAAEGARLVALSPWRIEWRNDPATRGALQAALAAPRVVFTSPNAVHAARALMPLQGRGAMRVFAVGSGTARALRNAGMDVDSSPARRDSEGLLALEGLQAVAGTDVGLVTAPGGRGLVAAALSSRGASVLRADVYARVPVAPGEAALARVRAISGPSWLALSSGEALQRIRAALPDAAWRALQRARVAAASDRLAAQARDFGFGDVVVAAGPGPRELVEAMARAHVDASPRG